MGVILGILKIAISIVGVIAGLLLIGMGIGYYAVQNDLAQLFQDIGISKPTIAILVLGIVILILSIMGFFSAFKSNFICSIIYGVAMGIIVIFLVVIAVMIFFKRSEFLKETGSMFDRIWNEREKPSAQTFLSKVYTCCGSKGPEDFGAIDMPEACCKSNVSGKCTILNAFKKGCRKEIINYMALRADFIGSVCIVTAIIITIIAICSFF